MTNVNGTEPIGVFRRTQAARYIGLSPSQFDRLRARGVVPHADVVLSPQVKGWRRATLDAVIDACTLEH